MASSIEVLEAEALQLPAADRARLVELVHELLEGAKTETAKS